MGDLISGLQSGHLAAPVLDKGARILLMPPERDVKTLKWDASEKHTLIPFSTPTALAKGRSGRPSSCVSACMEPWRVHVSKKTLRSLIVCVPVVVTYEFVHMLTHMHAYL